MGQFHMTCMTLSSILMGVGRELCREIPIRSTRAQGQVLFTVKRLKISKNRRKNDALKQSQRECTKISGMKDRCIPYPNPTMRNKVLLNLVLPILVLVLVFCSVLLELLQFFLCRSFLLMPTT